MPRLRHLAVAALFVVPSAGIAQGAADAPRTHTVKRGDTLWDLAKLYLSDAFLWPEIYRVNTDVVEDPHWIYPGEVLRIPDVAALMRPTADEQLARQPAAPPPPPRPVAAPPRPVYRLPAPTPRTAVRSREYLTSPFLAPDGGPEGGGRIRERATSGSAHSDIPDRLLQQNDLLVIEPPAGVQPVVGDRFTVYRLAERIPGRGQVVEPVGMVQVENTANAAGGIVLARLRDLYHAVHIGNRLMTLDTLAARANVFPAAVPEPTISGTVVWVQGEPLLPSIGNYVILDVTAADGVVTGDQITLVRRRGVDNNGTPLPDEVLAIAQVHRVTAQGAAAMLIAVDNGGTARGTVGRVTAKMP